MTLHEAIIKILNENNNSLTTSEIASAINKNKTYIKNDNSLVEPNQISARVRKYPELFKKNGATISLRSEKVVREPTLNKLDRNISVVDLKDIEKRLINNINFKPIDEIESFIADKPGMYCIRIVNESLLPTPFKEHLIQRNHNILYIGIASESLKKRFLNQELRAKGHGTFFRSIGALLGYRPQIGSLIDKANKRNFKFSKIDEQEIINWINSNLIFNYLEINTDYESVESQLIKAHKPLINIAKNPFAIKELSSLRNECVIIANSTL